MPREVRIYFEGNRLLKPGFDAFFRQLKERARRRRCRFELIASKSSAEACRDFDNALETHKSACNILLIDSDDPHNSQRAVTLCKKHNWDPSVAGSIFWMVEMMESWFHADKEALAAFYRDGFKKGALKANPDVELISKKDLERGLSAATKETKKGDYCNNKTSHGPKLLESINPALVRKAAPNCDRLFEAMISHLT